MNFRKITPLFFICCLVGMSVALAQTTVVKGIIKDKDSAEPLGFSTIIWSGTYQGAEAEWDGTFEITTDDLSLNAIEVAFMGYQTKKVSIQPGKTQEVEVLLEQEGVVGETVVVVAKRPRKDTAAITLFRKVVKAKSKLRESQYDSYQYEDYTKTEFDIFNVKESFKKSRVMRPFDFVFENMDTTESGIPFLPLMLKERLTDVFYQKNPQRRKEIIKADHFTGVDNIEFLELTDYTFPSIDIYDETVVIAGKAFSNPFSAGARTTYKYFLEDSLMRGDKFCYKLEFAPRRKADLAFTGHAWVDKETSMIKELEILVLDRVNINFLTGLEVSQRFDDLGDGNWFKTYEQLRVLMNILENKKSQAIRVVKTTTKEGVQVNHTIPNERFSGDEREILAEAYKREQSYWDTVRHEKLTENEAAIFSTMKRVKSTKTFKVYDYLGKTASSGYFNLGKIEVGRFFQIYSFNALEGNRFRLGVRSAPKYFRDKFSIGGYAAYGTKDKLFKYHIGASFHLKRKNNKWHQIGGHYRYDWSDYNFKNPYMTHDHLLSSLLRGRKNQLSNLFLIREGYGFYEKEWIKGFTNKFSFRHKSVYSWKNSSYDVTSDPAAPSSFQTAEFGVHTTYGAGLVTLNRRGGSSREVVDISAPVFEVDYTLGVKGLLGGDYNYHTLAVGVKHKLTTRVGLTYYGVTASKTWGDVPFPLLKVHKGNGSYIYNRNVYNMMDDLEYVNDAYVTFEARHFWQGFLMNMIPGINRLKLRSMFYGKVVYGTMNTQNKALLTANSTTLKPLEEVYGEVGVGILNIFKLVKLYGFMRLTQTDEPNVARFGFKFHISPSL